MAENKLLEIEIVTPQKVIYSGNAQSVSVPGAYSPFQILYNHAPIVSALDIGLVKIVDKSQKNLLFVVSSGFTEVAGNKVAILVEKAEEAEKVDPDAALQIIEQAKENLQSAKSKEEIENLKKEITYAEMLRKAAEKII